MDVQGWVVVGLTLVLFGYLVPHLVHSRQQLADARLDDRFSTSLRVVTTGGAERPSSAGEHHGGPGGRPYLHDPRRRTEAPAVNRPTTRSDRSAADARRLAAARAARAAEISRRKAAARRRLVLTLVLLVASLSGWLAVGFGSAPVALAVVPTLLLAVVLVLGRRAAKIAARRNAADRAAMARLELHPAPRKRPDAGAARPGAAGGTAAAAGSAATTRAGSGDAATSTRAGDAVTDGAPTQSVSGEGAGDETSVDTTTTATTASVEATAAEVATAEAATATAQEVAPHAAAPTTPAEEDGAWTPVPVPAPSYTLKAAAPRRDVAPYAPETPAPAQEDAGAAVPSSGLAGSPYGPVTPADTEVAPAPETAPATAMDLSTVLARRRAVGA